MLCGDGLLDAHLAERRGPQGRRPTKESPRTCVTLVDGWVRPCTYAYVEVTLVRNVNMSSGGSKGGCGTMRWMDRWVVERTVGGLDLLCLLETLQSSSRSQPGPSDRLSRVPLSNQTRTTFHARSLTDQGELEMRDALASGQLSST